MRELGFRRKSERYWRCVRNFGLGEGEYLSVFSWGEQRLPGPASGSARFVVEMTEFHVTFLVGIDHVHFYYHETRENAWQPAGHTSAGELHRLGRDPQTLRERADRIASRFITRLGGVRHPRGDDCARPSSDHSHD